MDKTVSKYIQEFNVFIGLVNSEFSRYTEIQTACEKEELDYLHQIELGEYKDRAKAATALHSCLIRRREAKDKLAALTPIKEWIDKNQTAINSLKITLGATRKKEINMKRQYFPRIVSDLPIAKKNTEE